MNRVLQEVIIDAVCTLIAKCRGVFKKYRVGLDFSMDGLKKYTGTKRVHINEVDTRKKKFWYDTVVPKG